MKICSVKDCTNKNWARGLCGKHLNHIRRYGEIRRLRSLPNEYRVEGDIVYITLYDVHRKPLIETLVDTELLPKIIKTRWAFSGFYAKEGTSKYVRYLHHEVIGKPEGLLVVDHINRNKLDNRLSNLRFVTRSENNKNR